MPPKGRRVTDNEAHTVLCEAGAKIADCEGETVRAETALRAAEKALLLLQLGLLSASEKAAEDDGGPHSD